jgi:sugar phosphate isomerase/epimerase
MLSVSTCWNSGRHTEGSEMLEELLDLGFTRVELGHGIRVSLMEGVQRMVEAGRVTISSLHNFCPLPVEITRASPDCYQFSSPDERERERAVKFSFQTIEFAVRLGCEVRRAASWPLAARRFHRSAHQARRSRPRSVAQIHPDQDRLRETARGEIRAVFPALARLSARVANYAAEKDIKLGVESRHSFEEIPSEDEMMSVLEQFNVPNVGYWHDFGHVQVKHNLGFLDHVEWMKRVAPRLIGCHLHDTQWPGAITWRHFRARWNTANSFRSFPRTRSSSLK